MLLLYISFRELEHNLQYRSEIRELRIRSPYAHTRMTIRVYAYDYTRIRVRRYVWRYAYTRILVWWYAYTRMTIRVYAYDDTRIRVWRYAYTRMTIRVYAYTYTRIRSSLLFTSNCLFCEVLLDKTIHSLVRKTQNARAVRLQSNLHIVETSSIKLSYNFPILFALKIYQVTTVEQLSLPTCNNCLGFFLFGKRISSACKHTFHFTAKFTGDTSIKSSNWCRVNSVTAEKPRHDLFIALRASNISMRNVLFEQ